MKFLEHFDLANIAISVGGAIKGMASSPTFLLFSSSTVGFIQIFLYRQDLTVDLMAAVGIAFIIMTVLGLIKHSKTGEWKGEIFIRKTVEQFIIMISVVLLGYIASIVISVIFRVVVHEVPGVGVVPGAALYFIFAGYAIMFTYYFIKCCDLIDQMKPQLLPTSFSSPFRKFRDSGNYKDLLTFGDEDGKKNAEDDDV